jgi:hypothetical protein
MYERYEGTPAHPTEAVVSTTGTGYALAYSGKYCRTTLATNYKFRNILDCKNWVKEYFPHIRYFYWRNESDWICAACS